MSILKYTTFWKEALQVWTQKLAWGSPKVPCSLSYSSCSVLVHWGLIRRFIRFLSLRSHQTVNDRQSCKVKKGHRTLEFTAYSTSTSILHLKHHFMTPSVWWRPGESKCFIFTLFEFTLYVNIFLISVEIHLSKAHWASGSSTGAG